MSKTYTPLDWYWLRPDGRSVYGSKSQTVVSLDDEAFAAWSADGTQPTLWPKDEAGTPTDAAMQAVLAPFGLTLPGIVPGEADLLAYAAAKRYAVEVSGVEATIADATVVVSTARDMRDGLRDTMLALVVGLRRDGAALKVFADGVPRAATNAEARDAVAAAFAHVQGAFNVEAALFQKIIAGEVETVAEIDAAAWPDPSGPSPVPPAKS